MGDIFSYKLLIMSCLFGLLEGKIYAISGSSADKRRAAHNHFFDGLIDFFYVVEAIYFELMRQQRLVDDHEAASVGIAPNRAQGARREAVGLVGEKCGGSHKCLFIFKF